MKILGIDTSSKFLSIALSGDKGLIAEESHLLDRSHSSLLVPKIKEMLKKNKVSISDIDGFIIGLGPGSFTGLRIGVSTAKGFGIATKKPCVGISSLDAMALAADGDNKVIVPIIDAKRKKLYSAIYKKEKDRIIKKSRYLLLGAEELMKKIDGKNGTVLFLGDGINLYKEKIQRFNKKAIFLGEEYWYPKAGALIKLGTKRIAGFGKKDMNKLKPIYLYPKDCQVRKP